MATRKLRYVVGDTGMVGHFAWDAGAAGPRPAVLVFPDAGGPGAHARQRAERLIAECGYSALACDIYGSQETMTDMAKIGQRLGAMRGDRDAMRALTLDVYRALAAQPEVDRARIAAIGFCFGGTAAFELALTGAELSAAIGFHCGLTVTSPDDFDAVRGRIVALLGADDPSITADARAAFEDRLRAAAVPWHMVVYGGVRHSFTNENAAAMGRPEFAAYDAFVDADSWVQMNRVLDCEFDSGR